MMTEKTPRPRRATIVPIIISLGYIGILFLFGLKGYLSVRDRWQFLDLEREGYHFTIIYPPGWGVLHQIGDTDGTKGVEDLRASFTHAAHFSLVPDAQVEIYWQRTVESPTLTQAQALGYEKFEQGFIVEPSGFQKVSSEQTNIGQGSYPTLVTTYYNEATQQTLEIYGLVNSNGIFTIVLAAKSNTDQAYEAMFTRMLDSFVIIEESDDK